MYSSKINSYTGKKAKTCRYCVNYNYKYNSCNNKPVNEKLDLRAARRCSDYRQISDNMKSTRKRKKPKRAEMEEAILKQEEREQWLMTNEVKKKNRDLSHRASKEAMLQLQELLADYDFETMFGTYEFEDELIEKLDNELYPE